ncbi:MAG: histidine phosphatase family protein [Verrucomicrobiota bacterium]
MKELLVIRHAKSSWDHPELADHDRPLNARGKAAAPRVAEELIRIGAAPEAFISSTAVRAFETAKVIARAFGGSEEEIVSVDELYGASARMILNTVQQFDEAWNRVAIFGHNPGFHDFVDRLLKKESVDRFPTCAVAHLKLDSDFWGSVEEGSAELLHFILPRELES